RVRPPGDDAASWGLEAGRVRDRGVPARALVAVGQRPRGLDGAPRVTGVEADVAGRDDLQVGADRPGGAVHAAALAGGEGELHAAAGVTAAPHPRARAGAPLAL